MSSKRALRHSYVDLDELHNAIWELVQACKARLTVIFEGELSRRMTYWDQYDMVNDLVLRISRKTMELIVKQVELALRSIKGRARTQRTRPLFWALYRTTWFTLFAYYMITSEIDNGERARKRRCSPHIASPILMFSDRKSQDPTEYINTEEIATGEGGVVLRGVPQELSGCTWSMRSDTVGGRPQGRIVRNTLHPADKLVAVLATPDPHVGAQSQLPQSLSRGQTKDFRMQRSIVTLPAYVEQPPTVSDLIDHMYPESSCGVVLRGLPPSPVAISSSPSHDRHGAQRKYHARHHDDTH
ncbi:hypothetical protein E4U61_004511 [Claviceps capensis]|nr:hypothetical protein E4U61_004511 [Claviceps capensis]